MTEAPDDLDDLDGCELDFTPDAVDDATVEMLPLFPHGDPGGRDATPEDWHSVLGDER